GPNRQEFLDVIFVEICQERVEHEKHLYASDGDDDGCGDHRQHRPDQALGVVPAGVSIREPALAELRHQFSAPQPTNGIERMIRLQPHPEVHRKILNEIKYEAGDRTDAAPIPPYFRRKSLPIPSGGTALE